MFSFFPFLFKICTRTAGWGEIAHFRLEPRYWLKGESKMADGHLDERSEYGRGKCFMRNMNGFRKLRCTSVGDGRRGSI